MGEDLSFFDRVHRDLRAVRWAEPGEIRARARRRSRRKALAAAAVLVVMSAPAYAAIGRDAPPGPPPVAASTAPAPTRAEIPLDALLGEGDVPGARAQLSGAAFAEQVHVDRGLEQCVTDQGGRIEPPASRYSRSQTLLRKIPGQNGRSMDGPLLWQDVYRLDPDLAARLVGGVERQVADCGVWRSVGPMLTEKGSVRVRSETRWEVTDRNFAGDESILLLEARKAPLSEATGKPVGPVRSGPVRLVVRVGDLVTVVTAMPEVPLYELVELGRAAATRMCPAANPSC